LASNAIPEPVCCELPKTPIENIENIPIEGMRDALFLGEGISL
jgi:hypothetical protein